MEIVTGLGAIALGLALWNEGWWHWLLVGVGLLGLVPLYGAAAILRKAERNPEILVTDPDRRRARGRRTMLTIAPIYAVGGGVLGYIAGGWGAAALVASIVAVSMGIGIWWAEHRDAGPK